MPQIVLPRRQFDRRLDNHLVGASLRILLETKRMNFVAWGGGAILNQGRFSFKGTKSLRIL